MDCVVNVNGCKIDIEYDGWFIHKDKECSDKNRDQKIIHNGMKVLRIKSGSLLPDEQCLVDSIIELSKTNQNYKEIILKDWEDRENINN